jgi:hypothetical protein
LKSERKKSNLLFERFPHASDVLHMSPSPRTKHQSVVRVVVNDEEWHVRRIEGMLYHRRPNREVWLPGIPPGSNPEEIETAYARLEITAPKASQEGRPT